ncbi:MAG TPA: SIS domain-containing protein [Terriglobales bacterium]|nr:SIS domain-containing protein [Terriglobales bacterium]
MSNLPSDRKAASPAAPHGAYTLVEILSQPLCWTISLRDLEDNGGLKTLAKQFSSAQEWIFIGCGSSFYVAQSAAATMTALTGRRAQAVPASELLLFPELVLAAKNNFVPVLISRSGRTSEVLRVAELLRDRGIATLGISCAPGQALEKLVTSVMVLPAADEQSMVMTRSFTSMLMALQALAATLAGGKQFLVAQRSLPASAEELLRTLPHRVHDFVSRHDFEDYVCLGQGALYGMACESALKLTEMSVSYGQSFHTLEFRHGPKSIVGKETLIMFLLSETGYSEELEVLEEVKKLGGTTLVIANRAEARTHASADLLVEFGVDGPEAARLPLYLIPGQLMGLYTGLKKGLDPDRPRNLSRVVVLEDEDSSETPEHAAI